MTLKLKEGQHKVIMQNSARFYIRECLFAGTNAGSFSCQCSKKQCINRKLADIWADYVIKSEHKDKNFI